MILGSSILFLTDLKLKCLCTLPYCSPRVNNQIWLRILGCVYTVILYTINIHNLKAVAESGLSVIELFSFDYWQYAQFLTRFLLLSYGNGL